MRLVNRCCMCTFIGTSLEGGRVWSNTEKMAIETPTDHFLTASVHCHKFVMFIIIRTVLRIIICSCQNVV
jgi:hypothetical protein